MEIRQLITFRTVASTLNFARAAQVLNYVPSNITMQIQALEEELGTRLIDRLGKGVVLTEHGKKFLLHVEKVLKDLEEAKLSVQESDEVTGTITISANEAILTYQLPAVFKIFRAQYPGVRIIFRPFPNELLKQSIYEGQTDVIFLLDEPVVSASLVTRTLKDEPFLLFTSPEHSLAGKKKVLASELSGEVFLLTQKGCTFRTLFDRLLERKGIEGITSLDFCSAEAIKQCVISGLGIGFLPRIAVKSELQRRELVSLPLDISNLNIKTQVVWHKDKWITPAFQAFIDIAKMVLGESTKKVC